MPVDDATSTAASGSGNAKALVCDKCAQEFPSRNKLFKHLRTGACATFYETVTVDGVTQQYLSLPREKSVVEFGYVGLSQAEMEEKFFDAVDFARCASASTADASAAALTLRKYSEQRPQYACSVGGDAKEKSSPENYLLSMDVGCSVASCVVSLPLEKLPLPPGHAQTADDFVRLMNQRLCAMQGADHAESKWSIRVWNRLPVGGGFNALFDCTIRQFEYVVPCSIVLKDEAGAATSAAIDGVATGDATTSPPKKSPRYSPTASATSKSGADQGGDDNFTLNTKFLPQLRAFKAALQPFRGRHHFHNFCDKDPVPHVPTALCRVSRLYMTGAACGREGEATAGSDLSPDSHFLVNGVPCMRFVLRADHWLSGQCRKLISVVTMIVHGLLPPSVVAVLLSPKAVVVGIPPAPVQGLCLAECLYHKHEEGKLASNLRSQGGHRAVAGESVSPAAKFLIQIHERAVKFESESGIYSRWIKQLHQAAPHIMQQVAMHAPLFPELRLTPQSPSSPCDGVDTLDNLPGPPASTATLYLRVLRLLQEAEASGKWPHVSAGRSRVLQLPSNATPHSRPGSSPRPKGKRKKDAAHSTHAKQPQQEPTNEDLTKASEEDATTEAPVTTRAGTFSIGAMPPPHKQPANRFPELMKAAFELEAAIAPPSRKVPSTTIAVNKHAQFLPHRDSGAGAGQSQSMIVGLGDYTGGELMVEGEKIDIRYKPVEFNGWKQRHYTLPFKGDRYSLVYFTPHGF